MKKIQSIKKTFVYLFTSLLLLLFSTPVYAWPWGGEEDEEQVGWLTKLIENSLGEQMEAAYRQFVGIVNKWVFQTPKLIEFDWVVTLWWYCFAISIILLCIGAGVSIFNIFSGRKGNTTGLLKSILLGFIGASLALFISDTIIGMSNFTVNSLMQDTLVEEYRNANNGSTSIDEDSISFESFDSVALCKIAFGGTLDDEPFYKVFLSENNGGGLFIMIWAMILLGFMGLFGIIRYGLIGLIGAGSAFWFASCSFTGDIKPAVGYINLFARSIFLSIILDLGWLFSVYSTGSSEFFGLSTQIIACVIFTLALIAAIWIWLRWVIKAVVHPMTLAGAQVQDHYGRLGARAGSTLSRVGQRFGMKGLETAGAGMAGKGKERQKIAKERMNGTYNPVEETKRDRLERARNQSVQKVLERDTKKPVFNDLEFGKSIVTKKKRGSETVGIDQEAYYQLLKKSNINFDTENDQFVIDDDDIDQVEKIIQKVFKKDHLKESTYDHTEGNLLTGLLKEKEEELVAHMKEQDIQYKQLHNVTVSKQVFDVVEKAIKDFNPIDEKLLTEMPFQNREGYGIMASNPEEMQKVEGVQKMLERFNIQHERVNSSLFFGKKEYDQLMKQVDHSKQVISGLNRKDDGSYQYTNEDQEKIIDMKNTLHSAGLETEEHKSIWINQDEEEKLLDSLLLVNEKGTNTKTNKEYARYSIQRKEDFESIIEDLQHKCPKGLLDWDDTKRTIIVDLEYSEEVDKLIHSYDKRTPYWTDNRGGYYYVDKKLRRIIKHLQKPKDGRFMGTYSG